MTPKKHALEIWHHIQDWSETTPRLLIAMDGYAGSGKTTLTNTLLALHPHHMEVLHLDDFIEPVEKRMHMIQTFPDPSVPFEKHWYRFDMLKDILTAYKEHRASSYEATLYDFEKNTISKKHTYDLSKKILLVEGIFLLHPENALSTCFDKKIFLSTPFATADGRRIQREKEKWGEEYQEESHPDNWTKYFITAYKRYYSQYQPERLSDIVMKSFT